MAVTQAKPVGSSVRVAAAVPSRSLWVDAWRRLRRNKIAVISAFVLVIIGVIAVIYPFIAPNDFLATVRDPATHRALPNKPPSLAHLFGTDSQARDVLARVLYGSRI